MNLLRRELLAEATVIVHQDGSTLFCPKAESHKDDLGRELIKHGAQMLADSPVKAIAVCIVHHTGISRVLALDDNSTATPLVHALMNHLSEIATTYGVKVKALFDTTRPPEQPGRV